MVDEKYSGRSKVKMIFDSHAHYDDEQFDRDRAALLTDILLQKCYRNNKYVLKL